MVELRKRPHLVLIATHGEWMGRSVESVLELNGYSVLRVDGGRRALELARGSSPDALILDTTLPEIDGIEVCRGLVDDPLFDHSTPIFMTSTAPVSNRVRLEAYESPQFFDHLKRVETNALSQPVSVVRSLMQLPADHHTLLFLEMGEAKLGHVASLDVVEIHSREDLQVGSCSPARGGCRWRFGRSGE